MNTALLSLLQLSDPALPIGSYAHSAGLETYVQQGIVHDVHSAKEFVEQMLSQNLQYNDAAFVSFAYDAAVRNDLQHISILDDECTAVKLASEIRAASQKLGIRLLKIFNTLCDHPAAKNYTVLVNSGESAGNYCIAFAVFGYAMQISKQDLLNGFLYNAAAGMVTNCVKLIPLGQLDGQKILFDLQTLINKLVINCMAPDEELTGLCCTGFDIRCMQHEQLYSRLYMS